MRTLRVRFYLIRPQLSWGVSQHTINHVGTERSHRRHYRRCSSATLRQARAQMDRMQSHGGCTRLSESAPSQEPSLSVGTSGGFSDSCNEAGLYVSRQAIMRRMLVLIALAIVFIVLAPLQTALALGLAAVVVLVGGYAAVAAMTAAVMLPLMIAGRTGCSRAGSCRKHRGGRNSDLYSPREYPPLARRAPGNNVLPMLPVQSVTYVPGRSHTDLANEGHD